MFEAHLHQRSAQCYLRKVKIAMIQVCGSPVLVVNYATVLTAHLATG